MTKHYIPARPTKAAGYCNKHRWHLSRAQMKVRKCLNETKRLQRRHGGKPCPWLDLIKEGVKVSENSQSIPANHQGNA